MYGVQKEKREKKLSCLRGCDSALCCGTNKENEIDCPVDCFFLSKSKKYFTDRQDSQKVIDFDREMKSVIGNEDPYVDVLQNIEAIISKICTAQGDCDQDVVVALEYIMEMGKSQLDLPSKFLTELPPNILSIVDAVNDILVSREAMGLKEDLLTRLKCVYRVLDSVRTHHDPKDKKSYLRFIGGYLSGPEN